MAQAGFPPPPNPIVVRGLQDQPEFRSAVFDEKGTIDPDLVEAEVVAVARDMLRERPDLGAVLLECSMLPPYAHAVQSALGVPVFDFVTMIDQFNKATHQQRYRSDEHTSELQSLMRISYAAFCLTKKQQHKLHIT